MADMSVEEIKYLENGSIFRCTTGIWIKLDDGLCSDTGFFYSWEIVGRSSMGDLNMLEMDLWDVTRVIDRVLTDG